MKFLSNKKFLLIAVLSILIVFLISLSFLSSKTKKESAVSGAPGLNGNNSSEIISPLPTVVPPTPSVNPQTATTETVTLVNNVLTSIKDNNFSAQKDIFLIGKNGYSSLDQVDSLLKNDREALTVNGEYIPKIITDETEFVDNKAQVVVAYQLPEKTVNVRYDLIVDNGFWKINNVEYGKTADLKVQETLITEAENLVPSPFYSQGTNNYLLPNGDRVYVEKNLFVLNSDYFEQLATSNDPVYQEFRFRLTKPQSGYTVVLYEAPYIKNYEAVIKDEDLVNKNLYHSFDIRDLDNSDKAVVLFYPENTAIDVEKMGIPPDPLLAIPLKLETE